MDRFKLFTKLVMCYSNNNPDEVYLVTQIALMFYNFYHDWREISKSKVILIHFDLDYIYIYIYICSYLMHINNNTHRCVNIDVQCDQLCLYSNCYAHRFYIHLLHFTVFLNSSQSVWNTRDIKIWFESFGIVLLASNGLFYATHSYLQIVSKHWS